MSTTTHTSTPTCWQCNLVPPHGEGRYCLDCINARAKARQVYGLPDTPLKMPHLVPPDMAQPDPADLPPPWTDFDANFAQPDPAHKHDAAKQRHSLLPPHALSQVIAVLEYGAGLYGQSNWKGGMRWSRPWNAAMRHLWAWWRGEENDPESNLPHLAHAAVNCLFLLEYKHNFKGEDDRGA